MNEFLQKLLLVIVAFCSILSSSCTHPWIGKTFPAAHYPQFSPGLEGHHTIPFEGGQVLLDYDWFTNEEKDRIWLDGTYKINDPNWNDLFKTSKFREGTIFSEMFLLDQNYKIIGTNKFVISFAVGLGYTVRNHKF